MRTNPEYAALAQRRALLNECISHLRTFTSESGIPPKGRVIAEEMIREDSELSEEDVGQFILELSQESEEIRLALSRFDFVKRGSDVQQQQPQAEASSQDRTKGADQKGKRKRHRPQ